MNSRRHTLAGCVAVALATSLAPTVVQADSSDSSTANELETVNVSALSKEVPARYHLGAIGWKHRDELLYAPSDPVTEGLLRNKQHAQH